jgi:hypothetical protein
MAERSGFELLVPSHAQVISCQMSVTDSDRQLKVSVERAVLVIFSSSTGSFSTARAHRTFVQVSGDAVRRLPYDAARGGGENCTKSSPSYRGNPIALEEDRVHW